MNYLEALKAMEQGAKVKLPEWTGYWFMENKQVKVQSKNGDVLTEPWLEKYHLRDDWEVTEGNMGFDFAINALKNGKCVARKGWNGKGMFLFMRPADDLEIDMIVHKVKSLPQSVKDYYADLTGTTQLDGRDKIKFTPFLCMKAADGTIVNGWLASQTDMLAEDWMVVSKL
jgi:hypothetical protein